MDQSKRNRASQNDRRSFLKSEMMPEGKPVSFFEKHKEGFKHLQTLQCFRHSRQESQHHPVLLIKHFSSHVMWCEHFLLWRNMMKPEPRSPLSFHFMLVTGIPIHPGSIPNTNWVVKSPPPKKTLEIHGNPIWLVVDLPRKHPKTMSSSVGMMTFPTSPALQLVGSAFLGHFNGEVHLPTMGKKRSSNHCYSLG